MEAIPSLEIRSLRAPSQEDWERHKPLIKRLYVDQGQKLDNIMATMLQFGHKASRRTYKNWIKRWGFEKKNKERDMVAILRKKTQREAAGKRSLFRVRGQPVTMEQVEYYFKRKKGALDTQIVDAPTPSDVSCCSPSPSPSPSPLDNEFAPFPDNEGPRAVQRTTQALLAWDTNDSSSGLIRAMPLMHIQTNQTILEENDIINILSENPTIRCPPLAPQNYYIPEHLFASIRYFYEMSIQTGAWTMNKDGYYRPSFRPRIGCPGDPDYDFYNYSDIAMAQLNKGAFVEARRALSKMFDQVNKIVQEGKPRTIDNILHVFTNLRRGGYHDLCLSLRNFIGRMAIIKSKDHPLGKICQFLSKLDEDSLDQAINQSWRCVIDGFISSTEPFGLDSVSIQLTFIEETYRDESGRPLVEAERYLEKLLTYYQANSSANPKVALRIMVSLGYNLFAQRRYDDAEALLQYIFSQTQKLNFFPVFEIQGRELLAWTQYCMKRRDVAEVNIRIALEMAKEHWGRSQVGTIEIKDTLKMWLKEWGREDEADSLQAEIGVFDLELEPDEIDLEISQGEG